jgi:hypothetical protein
MTTAQHQRLVALVRSDQKQWLLSKVTPLRSLADVVRDILDQAIANENQRR